MSWNRPLGSGLTNEYQNHSAFISLARFFGDCLRTKSTEVENIEGEYTEDRILEIMQDSWNENDLTNEQILAFEEALYSYLFRLFSGNAVTNNPQIYVDYDPPKIVQDAAADAGFVLKRGDLPVETKAFVNGLTVIITKRYNQGHQVLSHPIQAQL